MRKRIYQIIELSAFCFWDGQWVPSVENTSSATDSAGRDLIKGQHIPKEYRHAVAEIFVMHKDGSILLM